MDLGFSFKGAWVTIAIELMRREEFEQREITTKMVHYIFPCLYVPPPLPLPVLAQVPPPAPMCHPIA